MLKTSSILFAIIVSIISAYVYAVHKSALPYFYESSLFFDNNKKKLEDIVSELNKDKNISYVALSGKDEITVKFAESDSKKPLKKEQRTIYKNLLSDARVSPVMKIEIGILLYIGSEYKFGKNFNIAYILHNKAKPYKPLCNGNYKTDKQGDCNIKLEGNWVLNYQWITVDEPR